MLGILKQASKFKKISDAAKVRPRNTSQLTNAKKAYNEIYVPALKLIERDPTLNLADAIKILKPNVAPNTITNTLNRNYIRNQKNLSDNLPKEEFDKYKIILDRFEKEKGLYQAESLTLPKSVEGAITTYKSGPGIKQKKKFQKYFGDLEGEHSAVKEDRYALYNLGKTDDLDFYRQPQYATTKTRNELKKDIVKKIKRELANKDEYVTKIRETARQPEMMAKTGIKNLSEQANESQKLIDTYSKEAADLGLEIVMVDKKTGAFKNFGSQYPFMSNLKADVIRKGYSTGGIASLMKILNKLKLSDRQKRLILEARYSPLKKPGAGPKEERERRLRSFLMRNYGATPKYGYVKSEVPGPRTSLQRKRDEEFMRHTTFYPSKAAGGILSKYVR